MNNCDINAIERKWQRIEISTRIDALFIGIPLIFYRESANGLPFAMTMAQKPVCLQGTRHSAKLHSFVNWVHQCRLVRQKGLRYMTHAALLSSEPRHERNVHHNVSHQARTNLYLQRPDYPITSLACGSIWQIAQHVLRDDAHAHYYRCTPLESA